MSFLPIGIISYAYLLCNILWENYKVSCNTKVTFHGSGITTAWAYKKRLEKEQKKRSEIMAIKDIKARHKAISENMALFGQ